MPLLEVQGTEWQVRLAAAAPRDVQLAYTLELRTYLPLQPDGSTQHAAPKELHISRRYFVLKQTPPKQPDESVREPLNRPVRVRETIPERGNVTTLPPLVGERATGFALPNRSGRLFRYHNASGQPLVLVFWAFWCDTWKPTTQPIRHARLRPPYWDGEVWAICTDVCWTHRLAVDPVARLIDFPVLLDAGSHVSKQYAIDSVPTLVLIDRAGTVRRRLRGVPKRRWLESAVENLSDPSRDRDKPLCLTFDDFPQPGDENLLDVLQQLRLQVTLFAIGRNAERMPGLVRRAVAGGHILGNHSCSHRTAGMSIQAWIQDFEQANHILQRITGQKPRLLRLPGDPNAPVAQQVANALGMQAVGYTVNPYDFARPGTLALVERILAQAKPK